MRANLPLSFSSLFALFVLSCSNDSSSQESQASKSADPEETRKPTWEYEGKPDGGVAHSQWTAIPQANNKLRLAYLCYPKGKEKSYLFLQFLAPPSLVTTPVNDTHVAKAHIAWGHWDDLDAMTSVPADSVYMILHDNDQHIFKIRSRTLTQEADQRLQDKLRQHYEVAGIVFALYEKSFRTRNAAIFVDLVGSSAAFDIVSPLCSSH